VGEKPTTREKKDMRRVESRREREKRACVGMTSAWAVTTKSKEIVRSNDPSATDSNY
jgi:hypothetical protein